MFWKSPQKKPSGPLTICHNGMRIYDEYVGSLHVQLSTIIRKQEFNYHLSLIMNVGNYEHNDQISIIIIPALLFQTRV